jgi:16S rRNA (cytidine1402-2'-O)-methyltransferase
VSIAEAGLYVVATPLGNLDDISRRALDVLERVDLIAAEDTRHSRRLLSHYGIHTALTSLHEHNERDKLPGLLARLAAGQALALISDAGTPLVSDPGFVLVRAAREAGHPVVPVPGPSALICALSAAGLPSDRFLFEGFAPRRPAARRRWLDGLRGEPRTLVFYEASHRILDTLKDLAELFGSERRGVLARELTKLHETFIAGGLGELARRVEADPQQRKGEFVMLVAGAEPVGAAVGETERVLRILATELPLKRAAALTAEITGARRNELYQLGLDWKAGA